MPQVVVFLLIAAAVVAVWYLFARSWASSPVSATRIRTTGFGWR